MIRLCLFFCFLFLWSCSGSPEQPAQKPENAGYIFKTALAANNNLKLSVNQRFTPPEAQYYVHNELVESPLGLGPRCLPSDIEKKYGNGFTEKTHYPKNDQVKKSVDMEIVMQRDSNTLRLYNGILVFAKLENENIDIQRGIKVGLSKSQFQSKFKENSFSDLPDKFHIGNSSRTAYFTFFFEADTLREINYTSIY